MFNFIKAIRLSTRATGAAENITKQIVNNLINKNIIVPKVADTEVILKDAICACILLIAMTRKYNRKVVEKAWVAAAPELSSWLEKVTVSDRSSNDWLEWVVKTFPENCFDMASELSEKNPNLVGKEGLLWLPIFQEHLIENFTSWLNYNHILPDKYELDQSSQKYIKDELQKLIK